MERPAKLISVETAQMAKCKICYAFFRLFFRYVIPYFCTFARSLIFFINSGEEVFFFVEISETLPSQGSYQSILQSFIGFLFPLFPHYAHPCIANLIQSAASGE